MDRARSGAVHTRNVQRPGAAVTIGTLASPAPVGAYVARVDRRTALGNPFEMRGEHERDKVCEAYRRLLHDRHDPRAIAVDMGLRLPEPRWCTEAAAAARLQAVAKLRRMVTHGGDVHLVCHCAPRRCHAESIAGMLALD